MDLNKENKIGIKTTSRIPLPKEPLPKIPKQVLQKEVRLPLKNIQSETTNTANVEKKCPLKIDSTHVTVRRTEELDWDFKVFKDEKYALPNAGPSEKDVKITPLKSPLAVNRIKNIKKSLKRPHSRELLGLSPEPSQKKEGNFKRRLEFKNVDERLHLSDALSMTYMTCLTQDYNSDMFTYLLHAERRSAAPRMGSRPRACVINWIMKVNGNGNPAVVQSAVSYMDALLATRQVDAEHLQLVAAACFWLAQKNLGSYMSARRLVRASSQAFSVTKLVHAERTILKLLRFPTTPIVPQDFISYLSWSCESSKPAEVEAAATFICEAALMADKSMCNAYPSVIAAAAVRNAMLWLRRSLLKLHGNVVYQIAESKAQDFSYVCWAQKKAVCNMSDPQWKFKAPLEKYGTPPQFVAQRIVSAATEIHETLKNL
ncbi:uncharacterized protein LOC121736083 [Aricia agestis]|uniref:uncharacterized protein LOC121736083 n=1 Tax=Aricia agestis TaxID=91739 RepID=UPI001C205F4D|nr:uncharacterized protein LOC121736083 [Aricia agestis]